MEFLKNMSPVALLAFGFAVLVQFGFQAYALVLLFKTPETRVRWGRRWIWVLIILLGEIVGPLVFLVLGRMDAPADETVGGLVTGSAADEATKKAVDLLYGDRKE